MKENNEVIPGIEECTHKPKINLHYPIKRPDEPVYLHLYGLNKKQLKKVY